MEKSFVWFRYLIIFVLILSLGLLVGSAATLVSCQGSLFGPALLVSLVFWFPYFAVAWGIIFILAMIGMGIGLILDIKEIREGSKDGRG